jgi:TetR/AcrR family transcriptional regulator, transcriptional repressor for nem operon
MRPRRYTRSSARGEKGRQTRRDIVRKAAPLFNQKGFAGTSMSDLMAATGLQKGGLYRHFESKELLAQEAFDYAWEKAVNGRLDGLDEVPDAVGRLKGMIANFINKREGLVAGGCPLMNAAIESDDGNAVLRARARKALASWTDRVAAIVRDGITKGEIDASNDPQEFADVFVGALEGALMISRLRQNEAPLHAAAKFLSASLASASGSQR